MITQERAPVLNRAKLRILKNAQNRGFVLENANSVPVQIFLPVKHHSIAIEILRNLSKIGNASIIPLQYTICISGTPKAASSHKDEFPHPH